MQIERAPDLRKMCQMCYNSVRFRQKEKAKTD